MVIEPWKKGDLTNKNGDLTMKNRWFDGWFMLAKLVRKTGFTKENMGIYVILTIAAFLSW